MGDRVGQDHRPKWAQILALELVAAEARAAVDLISQLHVVLLVAERLIQKGGQNGHVRLAKHVVAVASVWPDVFDHGPATRFQSSGRSPERRQASLGRNRSTRPA